MGIMSPLGMNWAENEASLRANRTAFRPVTLFDVSHRIAKTAASIDLPDETLFPKLGRKASFVDRGTTMLMHSIRECLRHAKMADLDGIDALVIGTSAGAMPLGEEYFRQAVASETKVRGQLRRVDSYMPHRQMALITEEFGWQGPITLISNACASGANAIGHALGMIRTGRAKRVLAGGYDALADLVFSGFDSLKALAPSGTPRPFDAARDGLAIGEGASVMLIESEEAAAERRSDALACLCSYATATDLHHLTQPDPAGSAAVTTMTNACRIAGIEPDQIGYINSHGTGTPHNDVAEANAITQWAGAAAAGIPVSSTKSAMGHLLGGAGAVEASICLMALLGQWLPGSLNVREADPAVTFDLVREFRPAKLTHALTNSFGFGGTNATLILRTLEGGGA